MFKKLQQNNYIILNQLRLKLLYKSYHNSFLFNSVRLDIKLNKLKTVTDDSIFESSFLLEFISLRKSAITFFKKTYQQIDIQVTTILRKVFINYFILLLKTFYFPILIRRNDISKFNFDKLANYWLTLLDVKVYPFLSDVFFKWTIPVSCFFNMNKSYKLRSLLLLKYWNFPIKK